MFKKNNIKPDDLKLYDEYNENLEIYKYQDNWVVKNKDNGFYIRPDGKKESIQDDEPIHSYLIFKSKDQIENRIENKYYNNNKKSNNLLKYFNSNIEEVDRSIPSSQNVNINFVDFNSENKEINWSIEMEKFWMKLKAAQSGYEKYRKDIYGDFKTRYSGLIRKNKYARGDFVDLAFSGSIIIFGLIIAFISLFSIIIGNEGAKAVLLEPSRYGDVFLLSTIIVACSSILFWMGRRSNSKNTNKLLIKLGRLLVSIIVLSKLLIAFWISLTLTIGGGRDSVHQIEIMFWLLFTDYIPSVLPSSLGMIWLDLYNGYEAASPIGFSIFTVAILIIIVGSLTVIPVAKRSLARFILTANMSPREFRQKTGIYARENKKESDKEDNTDDTDYELGRLDEKINGDLIDNKRSVVNDSEKALSNKKDLLDLHKNTKNSPFKDYEEVRRYWVRAPYSYVSIVYNDKQNDYRYVVIEPELTDYEEFLFTRVKENLDIELIFEDIEEKDDIEEENAKKVKKLENKVLMIFNELDRKTNSTTFHKIMYYIERDYVYYDKIDPIMNDPNIEDISCDGDNAPIFVFHKDYKDIMTNVVFEKDRLYSFVQKLAQRSGEQINSAKPIADVSLPDGSRANLTLGTEVTDEGSTFTIRLFKDIPFTPVDLLNYNTFSIDQMSYLWLAIENNKSLIFAGGTASGKTTSMNAISIFIPPKSKIVTIEDTREITLPQENVIYGTTRDGLDEDDGGDIGMYDLLVSALRQRPEYLVVGEIRGAEAETLFQAMNTGHTTYSTMHADNVDAAIGRLTNPPINVPRQMITALDIICIQNQKRLKNEDGEVRNVRRNEIMREIVRMRENGSFVNRRPYQWDAETDTFIESLEDSHVLAQIQNENGWSKERIREELKERKEVLKYMQDNNISEFNNVSKIIQSYMVDSDNIIQKVRNGTLDPTELKRLTEITLVDEENESNNQIEQNDYDIKSLEGNTIEDNQGE